MKNHQSVVDGHIHWMMLEQLLTSAMELGCNFVRLAHYPHNEYMTRLADKMGILVWSEIPVYWTILWDNQDTYKLASQQLSEMIKETRTVLR